MDVSTLINKANQVFKRSCWLFDLAHVHGDLAWGHLPLIYATKYKVQQELYCDSANIFSSWFHSGKKLEYSIVDGVVFSYKHESLYLFKSEVIKEIIVKGHVAKEIMSKIIVSRSILPKICLLNEAQFLKYRKVKWHELSKLLDELSTAIAINLLNPFLELMCFHFLEPGKYYDDIRELYIETPYYSYLKHFDNSWNSLVRLSRTGGITNSDVVNFCWNVGFLASGSNDGSCYEDPNFVASKLNVRNDREEDFKIRNYPEIASFPKFTIDDSNLTSDISFKNNFLEYCFHLLRHLAVHEEVRHYWQGRSLRLIRFIMGNEIVPYEYGRDALKVNSFVEQ